MSVAAGDARVQGARWDSGRLRLGLRHGPRLLARGLRERDRVALDAAIDPLLPPQALLAGMNLAGAVAALAARRRAPLVLAAAGLGAQAGFVLGGLAAAGASREAWLGLAHAPRFLAGRLRTFGEMGVGRGPREWSKTAREAVG